MLRPWVRHFAALLVLALPCLQAAADPIIIVWRADTRPPEEVFQGGFLGRGQNPDLLAHTVGGSCEDQDPARATLFVSTSADRDEALGFAEGHLEGLPSGPSNRMWLYAIRPDAGFITVPLLLRRVADLAYAGQAGYQPAHGPVLDHLLYNTLIATEAEVVVPHIPPANIMNAMPVWFGQDDNLVHGPTVVNPAYIDAFTSANSNVPVESLQTYVPAASIRLDLMDDDGSSSGSESDQCSMTCDGASSASTFAASPSPMRVAPVCKLPKTLTPFLRDLILG